MKRDWDSVYRSTDYCLWLAGQQWVLHIDQAAPKVIAALTDHVGLQRHAFIITPCNPRSEQLGADENRARLTGFRAGLNDDNVRWLPAVNRDPAGNWPDEPGALLVDCSPAYARKLARNYQQNAWVQISPGRAPRLIYP